MKDEPEMVIPLDRLPPGFAEQLDAPGRTVEPRPAATAVLIRDAADGPEILLLRRHRAAGFVPGAWVFPGGRVDEADGDPELVRSLSIVPRGAAPQYWLAAIREVFEETGILLARDLDTGVHTAAAHAQDAEFRDRLAAWRERLLAGDATLHEMLTALRCAPDITSMVYCSHWITPVAEPKRYDTRFFLAEVSGDVDVTIDEREMSAARWLNARAALEQFRAGTLPMVFPTVKTIQLLLPYRSAHDMLTAFRESEIPAVLPRLVRTRDGVGIVMPDNE